jgi:hypothetical protein
MSIMGSMKAMCGKTHINYSHYSYAVRQRLWTKARTMPWNKSLPIYRDFLPTNALLLI